MFATEVDSIPQCTFTKINGMKNQIKLTVASLMVLVAASLSAQSLNPNWNTELKTSLQDLLACQNSGDAKVCTRFLGESLQTVYKVNDIYSPKSGQYMGVGEIVSFLKTSKQWSQLGHAYEQDILLRAQDQANAKKAVVAVYLNEAGIGHVVVITPGKVQRSGSWGLDVPNAASFFATQPDKSFVDKSLAFAFSKSMLKDIVIYARNY